MRIDSINLENFRCFEEITLHFHPNLTVLTAPNGQGKTTIIDAIRIALWPYVSAFDVVSGTMPKSGIEVDDVRIRQTINMNMEPQLPASICAKAIYQGREITWCRKREKVSKGSKTLVREAWPLSTLGEELQSKIRMESEHDSEINHLETVLPLVAHYGTARLWKQRKLTINKQDRSAFFSRTYAYMSCLDSASDYKSFADWFFYIFAADFEQRTKKMEKSGFAGLNDDGVDYGLLLEAISLTVDKITKSEGWGGLRYSPSQGTLVMGNEDLGELKLDQLSDGFRNIIAMTADIAYRCVRLNPQLGERAAQETQGIVLIDEVDMHLHPDWQQTILTSLRSAFPRVQFIVSTHSPQVLSTVRQENVRVIELNDGGVGKASFPLARTYGEPSGDVLHSVMQVDPLPPIHEKKDLQKLTEWIDQGLYDKPEAVALMSDLIQLLGESHPQIQKLQRSIVRQRKLNG